MLYAWRMRLKTLRWFLTEASWTGRKFWLFETLDSVFDWIEFRWPRVRPLTSKIWAPGPHVPHGDYDQMMEGPCR